MKNLVASAVICMIGVTHATFGQPMAIERTRILGISGQYVFDQDICLTTIQGEARENSNADATFFSNTTSSANQSGEGIFLWTRSTNQLSTLIHTGDGASFVPATDPVFMLSHYPVINSARDVAVMAVLRDQAAGDRSAVLCVHAGSVYRVVQDGDCAPVGSGSCVSGGSVDWRFRFPLPSPQFDQGFARVAITRPVESPESVSVLFLADLVSESDHNEVRASLWTWSPSIGLELVVMQGSVIAETDDVPPQAIYATEVYGPSLGQADFNESLRTVVFLRGEVAGGSRTFEGVWQHTSTTGISPVDFATVELGVDQVPSTPEVDNHHIDPVVYAGPGTNTVFRWRSRVGSTLLANIHLSVTDGMSNSSVIGPGLPANGMLFNPQNGSAGCPAPCFGGGQFATATHLITSSQAMASMSAGMEAAFVWAGINSACSVESGGVWTTGLDCFTQQGECIYDSTAANDACRDCSTGGWRFSEFAGNRSSSVVWAQSTQPSTSISDSGIVAFVALTDSSPGRTGIFTFDRTQPNPGRRVAIEGDTLALGSTTHELQELGLAIDGTRPANLRSGGGIVAQSGEVIYVARFTNGTSAVLQFAPYLATGHTCIHNPDVNGDGQVTLQDLFDFQNYWFAGNPAADFDCNGSVTVQDLFSFLDEWFRLNGTMLPCSIN